jgi:hypothetical protein
MGLVASESEPKIPVECGCVAEAVVVRSHTGAHFGVPDTGLGGSPTPSQYPLPSDHLRSIKFIAHTRALYEVVSSDA